MSNESMVTHADDRAQFLQNFLEFHHARSLRAIEWDAIVAFLEANPRTAAQPEREDVPRETHNIISSHIPGGWMCADCGMKEPKLSLRECPAALTTPAPAVSTDEAIEQIVVGFSDKAILRLDIDEDDPRLSLICDEMRCDTRAILSRLRGEG